MPQTPHVERHFTAGERVRDVVIGMSDGLTVPFALPAGLSGAVSSTGIIVTAGLAEIAAGSIAMGLGGYLAARSDAEHYASERAREVTEVQEKPAVEADEVTEVFRTYGLTAEESAPVVEAPLVALTLFGYVKGHFTGAAPARSALQTAMIGGLAAAAAFGIARAIG
jgi:VIT1/CCC1 family predicted Fe2+/Mn2+ transporter